MRVHRSYFSATDATDVSITAAFSATAKSTVDLRDGKKILCRISGITVQLKSMASGSGGTLPTSLTMRITTDAAGDTCLITDTASTISAGITTATVGTADYKADVDVALADSKVYVFCKTNTGTADVDSVTITYEQ